jgi:uncharacterized repeat protein (TIGR01451 family)
MKSGASLWMTLSARTRRGLVLLWSALFLSSLLFQYGLIAPSTTLAVHDEGLFQLDGNATTDPSPPAPAGDDWDRVYNSTSSADSTRFIVDPVDSATDDTYTGGSTKDDEPISAWLWKYAKASQAKNDITHAFAAAYTGPSDHAIIYFGLNKYEADGDNFVGFWFLQDQVGRTGAGTPPGSPFTGSHQVGDILVLADYTNGGALATFSVLRWVGSGGDANAAGTLDTVASGVPCTAGGAASDLACGATNGVNVPAPWPFVGRDAKAGEENTFLPGTFFEGGIDLTALGLDNSCFSTFIAETRASQSVDATLSDFAMGGFSFCETPTLETTASPSSLVIGSGTVSDVAHLSGSKGVPQGTVDFFLCGPTGSAADCATGGVNAGAGKVVDGSGNATSDAMTLTAPGWYCFRAEYNPAEGSKYFATSHTNSTSECVHVLKASPGIATSATESVSAGNAISDSATLSGGYSPTGSITFRAYGPDDASCSAAPVFTSNPVTVNGNGTYGPVSFTPAAAGVYRWIASYSGDPNNNAVSGACNDAGETDTVTKVNPTISTSATESVTIGGAIHDSAILAGGVNPTGTITFTLYGPNDASCTGQAAYSTSVSVSGNGTYGPVSFTPTAVGTYTWIAAYSGDANNNAVTGLCSDAGETDTVNPAAPAISTTASGTVEVGSDISDTAHLTGGVGPTGSITFELYGPDNASCSGEPIFTDQVAVDGNGDYVSGAFTALQAGTYRWIASYSGDASNLAVSGACNDANESVVVTKANPSIATTLVAGEAASAHLTLPIGTSVHDTATLTGATSDAGGTVTYTVYTNSSCSLGAQAAGTVTVTNGVVPASNDIVFNAAGTYYWQAAYSGDANNNGATSNCLDETVTISTNPVTINTSLSGQGQEGAEITVQINNTVTDSATLTGATANAGGTVTYTVFSDDACETVFADGGTVAVTNGAVPDSNPVIFDTAGTFYWQAVYSGDANNDPATSTCTDEVVNVIVPAIAIAKSVDDADHIVARGQTLTYSLALTVVNGPVTSSVVSDPLPAGQTFVSASNGGTYDAASRTINWDLGTLQSGDPVLTLTYVVTVDATAPTGDQVNTATFDTEETDPASDDETVTVPDLTIVKSYTGNTGGTLGDGTQISKIGDTLTFTLAYTLTNGPVHNGVISDVLPEGTDYVVGSATNNAEFTFISYTAASRTLTWEADQVTQSGNVTYQVSVLDTAPELQQPLVNTVTIGSDETSPDSDTADVFVQAPPEEATATPVVTLPPTSTAPESGQPAGTGLNLSLILLLLGAFALVLGHVTPAPERIRRRNEHR